MAGSLKIPIIDKSKAYKCESYILHNIESINKIDAQQTFKTIYELCEPYLQELGYERTIRFMKKQDFIDA